MSQSITCVLWFITDTVCLNDIGKSFTLFFPHSNIRCAFRKQQDVLDRSTCLPSFCFSDMNLPIGLSLCLKGRLETRYGINKAYCSQGMLFFHGCMVRFPAQLGRQEAVLEAGQLPVTPCDFLADICQNDTQAKIMTHIEKKPSTVTVSKSDSLEGCPFTW